MNKKLSIKEQYCIMLFERIIKYAPIVGAVALVSFTSAKILGFFPNTSVLSVVIFDLCCLSYFGVAGALGKRGVVKDGEFDYKSFRLTEYVIIAVTVLQWNIITYIFPLRELWGYFALFILLVAFLFEVRAVLIEIALIVLSISVSWFILGDKIMPYDDGMYAENISFIFVCIAITSFTIVLMTQISAQLLRIAADNEKELEEKNSRLDQMSKDIIEYTADIIESRDATSGQHIRRVRWLTESIAKELAADYPEYEFDDEKIRHIGLASVLHDVGKISIPDSILNKPGKLTEEEFEIMKTHTRLGAEVIDLMPESVTDEFKAYCRKICLYHHEKYDGKGYPEGLKGDDIPIEAQIVSVVDCFDALTSERPYKHAFSEEKALEMILNGECGAFSDKIKSSLIKTVTYKEPEVVDE